MKWLALMLPLLLMGCANIRLVHWDHDTYTFCGSNWADPLDFEDKFEKQCGDDDYNVLSGGVYQTGGYTVSSSAFTPTTIEPNRMNCQTIQCVKNSSP